MSWQALNLTAPEFAKPSEPPWLCGLIYRGKRHAISGPPEAAKTLAALTIALEAIRAGALVAFIDFESGPAETRRLLEKPWCHRQGDRRRALHRGRQPAR